MNRTPVVGFALGLVLAGVTAPGLAVETPRPGAADARVRSIDYDPLQVVHITGVYRTATQILFGDDETILHVAVGDATAWDVAAEKNILFIKPKAAHGLTNLIVTTSRPDGATGASATRNYTFELTIQGQPSHHARAALFVLRFRYPADLKAAAAAAISAEEQAILARLTALKLERGAVEGRRNLAYQVQGATALQPSEVSDNGRFTILRFPAGQPVPAIYQVTPDGTESLIPFDVRGEFVVIHGTARQFRLRRGRDVLCIYNAATDPYGVNLGTQTAAPDVDRTDIGLPPPPKPKSPAAKPGAGQP
jgi:type IV secretion system protein VirB9